MSLSCVAVSLTLLFVTACAPPLRIRQVTPTEFYREQTRSVLSSSDLSEPTRTVLRRHDLLARYEEQLDQTIAALHEVILRGPGVGGELFALAELSLFRAERDASAPHYLAAALYAYAFLFPDDPRDTPDALDPRTRMACDLYNRALAKALQGRAGDYVTLRTGVFPLPFGAMTISVEMGSVVWGDYRLVDFLPLEGLEVEGMRNQYREAGIGVPISARAAPIAGEYGADDLIGPNNRVPVTIVLRVDHPRHQLATTSLEGTLEVHATTDEESIRIGARNVRLEAERTTALATSLVAARPWDAELSAFFGGGVLFRSQPAVLRAMQPYRRGKIPVVFIHGTASSIFRWADMVNDLLDDTSIRGGFQFWFFTYDSGNPILYSAYRLRKILSEKVAEFERDGPDPALHEMVVIGHSQGGLLAKLTAVDSGDRFWNNMSRERFEDAPMSAETRSLLKEGAFVTPLPFVRRVIFICTPHRGSFLAGPQFIRRLIKRFVRLPLDVLEAGAEITGLSGGGELTMEHLPTSIDNMDPKNRFIRTLQEIPIAPGVTAHSIIAVKQEKDIAQGDDGVVKYQSAHIDGVESEFVVQSDHSAQANPHTVEEVRRILLEHLAAAHAEFGDSSPEADPYGAPLLPAHSP